MNRLRTTTVVAVVVTALLTSPTWALPTYTGMLASDFDSGNSMGAHGLLVGNNGWTQASQPLVLRWTVSFDGSLWHYEYTFNELELQGAMSHVIVEVSDVLLPADIIDPSYAFEGPAQYNPGDPANPSLPGSVWGVKFDTVGVEGVGVVTFASPRAPVWGDIYIKDGTQGGAAWNAWFTDPDNDPLVAPSNGSYQSHVLVPDTVTPPIPSPAAIFLGGLGTVAVGWLRRKRIIA